jgi:glucosylceramidase
MRWAVVCVIWLGCGQPDRDDACVGSAALDEPTIDTGVGAGVAGMWWSSESHPFAVDSSDTTWFDCPRAIAHELERRPDLPFAAANDTAAAVIEIDPTTQYQSILGTGISMEAASVANLLQLSPADRHDVLTRMFDPQRGMGMNLVRITIGTSDFTGTDWYTYDDVAGGDPSLAQFSIQRDLDLGIVDVLHEMQAINPDLLFFASPWSPPGWMKTSGQIAGGALRDDKIDVYATYLRRFVEAYRDQGISLVGLTLQNEPRADWDQMPTCLVTAEQEATLVRALKRELTTAGLTTELWVYDHNFDAALDYAGDLFRDPAALAASDGVAFHDYAGDPTAMSAVHAQFPGKDIFFTEKALWGVAGVDRAAQYFRNWSRTYVSWVTMLDQTGGPNRGPNSEKPRRFMRSTHFADAAFYATPEHYLFGLYSRFVQPGARRIESSAGSADAVTDVAFVNPDGTIAVIVINQTDAPQAFALRSEGNQLVTSIDPTTAATLLWHR